MAGAAFCFHARSSTDFVGVGMLSPVRHKSFVETSAPPALLEYTWYVCVFKQNVQRRHTTKKHIKSVARFSLGRARVFLVKQLARSLRWAARLREHASGRGAACECAWSSERLVSPWAA